MFQTISAFALTGPVFELGTMTVTWMEIIAAAVLLFVVFIMLIVVINGVKKQNRSRGVKSGKRARSADMKTADKSAVEKGKELAAGMGETPAPAVVVVPAAASETVVSKPQPAPVAAPTPVVTPAPVVVASPVVVATPVTRESVAIIQPDNKSEKDKRKQAKLAAKQAKAEAKAEKKEEKLRKATAKKLRKYNIESEVEPIVVLLGFDPYSPVDLSGYSVSTDKYVDIDMDTDEIRELREKRRSSQFTAVKVRELNGRLLKVRAEIKKQQRVREDKSLIVSSTSAVVEKLTQEYNALSADKKMRKANKNRLALIQVELSEQEATIAQAKADTRRSAENEALIKEAESYLVMEVARVERELDSINADVARLDKIVGVDIKKLDRDNRGRSIMEKFPELRPMLVKINAAYREVDRLDGELTSAHTKKYEVKAKLDGKLEELNASTDAKRTSEVSAEVSALNRQLVACGAEEDRILAAREAKTVEYKETKAAMTAFIESGKCAFGDIVAAEDKVVSELTFDELKTQYLGKQRATATELERAKSNYDSITTRKVKFKKHDEEKRRQYEKEIQAAHSVLQVAREEAEKANDDVKNVLPRLTPLTLYKEGSGVIYRDYMAKNFGNEEIQSQDDFLAASKREQPEKSSTETAGLPELPVATQNPAGNVPAIRESASSGDYAKLMRQLDDLKRLVMAEKQQRKFMREQDIAYGDEQMSKIEQRKVQIVNMRKNLKYINSPAAAEEFKEKLRRLALTFDEEEMNDAVLNEMIRRTMKEATYRGQRAEARRNGKA